MSSFQDHFFLSCPLYGVYFILFSWMDLFPFLLGCFLFCIHMWMSILHIKINLMVIHSIECLDHYLSNPILTSFNNIVDDFITTTSILNLYQITVHTSANCLVFLPLIIASLTNLEAAKARYLIENGPKIPMEQTKCARKQRVFTFRFQQLSLSQLLSALCRIMPHGTHISDMSLYLEYPLGHS